MARRLRGGNAVGAGAPVRRQRGGYGRAQWFECALVPAGERVLASPSQSSVTERDAVVLRSAPGSFAQDYDLRLDLLQRPHAAAPAVSLPVNAYLDQDPLTPLRLRTLATGPAQTVTLVTPSRTLDLPVAPTVRTAGGAHDAWQSWVAGSLAAHCASAVDTRIAGKVVSAARPLYTTQNHAGGVYVRNPDAWCADLAAKLTCISPWKSSGVVNRAGATAITARHTIQAAHAGYGVGTQVRFITADNQVVTRTITRVRNATGYMAYTDKDYQVALLDADLPGSITPCRLAPANLETYLPGIGYRVPGLMLDQEELALVGDLTGLGSEAAWRRPTEANRLAFYQGLVGGDSGNPAFLLVNGELVLVSVWSASDYTSYAYGEDLGDFLSDLAVCISAVDAQAGISTGYTVTPADLSAFPSYA